MAGCCATVGVVISATINNDTNRPNPRPLRFEQVPDPAEISPLRQPAVRQLYAGVHAGPVTNLGPGRNRFRQKTFALGAFAGQFPRPADGLALPTRLGFGRLLVSRAGLHFPENALALHLFLEGLQRLVDVVVPDHDNYDLKLSIAVPALAWPHQITGPDITEDPDCPPFPRDGGWRGAAGPYGPF